MTHFLFEIISWKSELDMERWGPEFPGQELQVHVRISARQW